MSTLKVLVNHAIGSSPFLRTDDAFDPWVSSLTDALLRLFPLPPHLSSLPTDELPTPRVTLLSATSEELQGAPDPLVGDDRYHTFELIRNERITADDWYQDVRHFEFQCQDDLLYAIFHMYSKGIDPFNTAMTQGMLLSFTRKHPP